MRIFQTNSIVSFWSKVIPTAGAAERIGKVIKCYSFTDIFSRLRSLKGFSDRAKNRPHESQ
jgi:hypothetical protein